MVINKDEVDAVAKAAAEIVKAVPVYPDAVQPVAQEIGKSLKTLGGVINVALAPLAAMVYGYEKIGEHLKKKLESRLSAISPDNIIAPPLQVVGPLIERYKYIHDNDDLSEMFVNLLSNAMDKDKVRKAHPSFVNVISELSPDEAKLIKYFSKEDTLPKLDVQIKAKPPEEEFGYINVYFNFTLLGEKAGLTYEDLTSYYLSNLERLRIISCTYNSESYKNKDYYKPLQESPNLEKIKKMYEDEYIVESKEGVIQITDFGKLFIEAVI